MKLDMDDNINIDLTPLIDVVFMLLIFFIMTTTFSKPVLDIILPSSDTAAAAEQKSEEIIITVNAAGVIHNGDTPITNEQLTALLQEKPDGLLNLFMDEKAPFEVFVAIVDIAKKERGGRFVISAQDAGK